MANALRGFSIYLKGDDRKTWREESRHLRSGLGANLHRRLRKPPSAMTKSKKTAETPLSDIPALEGAIADFDRTDLLSAIAGLQLLPANAERIVRLEAFAYLVASGKSKKSRKVAPHALAPLCNCEALQTIAHAEDPFDGVFCEEVLFHGGSYKVLPGITEHATFILKRINETIFFHRDSFPDASFVRTATHLIHGTLALSDRMCELAGVRRNPVLSTNRGRKHRGPGRKTTG